MGYPSFALRVCATSVFIVSFGGGMAMGADDSRRAPYSFNFANAGTSEAGAIALMGSAAWVLGGRLRRRITSSRDAGQPPRTMRSKGAGDAIHSRTVVGVLDNPDNDVSDDGVAEQYQRSDSNAQPRVSIVLASYNRAAMLDNAIQVVRRQSMQDWELLVVDDCSQDNTAEVGRAWAERDSRIVFIRHGVNQKISRAYNTAFRRARGEYIAMMDDDDAWCVEDKLERQLAFLDSNLDYVACGGGLIVVNPSGREKYRYLKPESDEQIRGVMLLSNPIANSTSMFRRVAGEMVGWYDATLPLAGDRDFWMKLARLGKMHNFPEHLAYYTMGEHNNTIVHIRPHLRISLMLTIRYRKVYPRYTSALVINFAQYLYAYLPLSCRRFFHAHVARAKRAVELAVARRQDRESVHK